MSRLTWIAALFFAACPPRPASPDAQVAPEECPTAAHPTGEDACDGMFDENGHACFRCPDQQGCVDRDLQVYCAGGPCALDPNCHVVPIGGSKR